MTMTKILLAAALAGCAAQDATTQATAAVTSAVVKDLPAVNRALYPDSIGYLYTGDTATMVWMQNKFEVPSRGDLENLLRRSMARGLSGELVANRMQHIGPITGAAPTLPIMAQRTTQTVRLASQYNFMAQDYAGSLGGALATYNADPARLQEITDAAARIDAALAGTGPVSPGNPLPAPPPPAHSGPIQPGRYFAETVTATARGRLEASAGVLQRAVAAHNPAAYGAVFGDVFYAQAEPALRDRAHAVLSVSHVDGVLTGQPLDFVITQFVLPAPASELGLQMEQLRLINQINLLANQVVTVRRPLVAALLLFAEDRRGGEADLQLSVAAIWAHVQDLDWLVAQYVRIHGHGVSPATFLNQIDTILSNNAAH